VRPVFQGNTLVPAAEAPACPPAAEASASSQTDTPTTSSDSSETAPAGVEARASEAIIDSARIVTLPDATDTVAAAINTARREPPASAPAPSLPHHRGAPLLSAANAANRESNLRGDEYLYAPRPASSGLRTASNIEAGQAKPQLQALPCDAGDTKAAATKKTGTEPPASAQAHSLPHQRGAPVLSAANTANRESNLRGDASSGLQAASNIDAVQECKAQPKARPKTGTRESGLRGDEYLYVPARAPVVTGEVSGSLGGGSSADVQGQVGRSPSGRPILMGDATAVAEQPPHMLDGEAGVGHTGPVREGSGMSMPAIPRTVPDPVMIAVRDSMLSDHELSMMVDVVRSQREKSRAVSQISSAAETGATNAEASSSPTPQKSPQVHDAPRQMPQNTTMVTRGGDALLQSSNAVGRGVAGPSPSSTASTDPIRVISYVDRLAWDTEPLLHPRLCMHPCVVPSFPSLTDYCIGVQGGCTRVAKRTLTNKVCNDQCVNQANEQSTCRKRQRVCVSYTYARSAIRDSAPK